MISNRDTTVSKIVTPDVFRHTPFEHETTTDSVNSLTTIDPTTVTVQHRVSDGTVLAPSLPNLARLAGMAGL
jgi:hypothetical protein